MQLYISAYERSIAIELIELNMLPYMTKNELIVLAYVRDIRIMPTDTKSMIMDYIIVDMIQS